MKKIIFIFFLSILVGIGRERWSQSLPDKLPDKISQIVNNEFSLAVDYSKTLDQMIADGKYDWVSDIDINKGHFPLPTELIGKKVNFMAKIFHFNRKISSEDAINEMDKLGYRPATIAELLALGKKYPELQCRFPIVALGSIYSSLWRWHWNESFVFCRFVSCLNSDTPGRDNNNADYPNGRMLYSNFFDYGWDTNNRFLAVCKKV